MCHLVYLTNCVFYSMHISNPSTWNKTDEVTDQLVQANSDKFWPFSAGLVEDNLWNITKM
jgi:hypothetical protein